MSVFPEIEISYSKINESQWHCHVESHTPLPFGWVDIAIRKEVDCTVIFIIDNCTELLRAELSFEQVRNILPEMLRIASSAFLEGCQEGGDG